ncbi:hypothetical protein HDU82_000936 [Entophlyctis luteolus]|nr:hypothetical protein HDU82_000927 [Entophlyctis luteolus]KAJ3212514.1 hypothetical protein HDU82_000936 [Entophlyctis luteolus]
MAQDRADATVVAAQTAAIERETERALAASLAATRSVISKIGAANAHAAVTLGVLAEQGGWLRASDRDAIQKVSHTLEKIEDTAKAADAKVKKLKKLSGWLPRVKAPKWMKTKRRVQLDAESEGSSQRYTEDILPTSSIRALEELAFDIRNIQPMLVEPVPAADVRQAMNQEIECNLDSVSVSLKMLKLATMAMGDEIDRQNLQLESVGISADCATRAVSNVDGRLKSIK